MKFSYNWLQSYFEEKLPKPEELAELLTMRSFEVEEVTKNLESGIKNLDYFLDIDILPNRAHDCLSHYGLAREIAALLDSKFHILNSVKLIEIEHGENLLNVKIENETLCPRYSAYVLEGIKISDSPDWIKERLASVGQKPINNVVDITNYIVWELGQPLHAFDFSKIKGQSMTIRESRNGETLETLDKLNRELGDGTIIIGDSERLIDLAGIKGGANTKVDDKTDKIIFQAAIFDPLHIRRTSQKLGIRTDAAVRYMHGFDPELPLQALERAVELLKETNPDAKVIQQIDIYPEPAKQKEISLEWNYVNKLLGANLSDGEMQNILDRIGCTLKPLRGDPTVVGSTKQFRNNGGKTPELLRSVRKDIAVPSYRLDIELPEDLIEEIGRIYGYENIKEKAPRGILVTPRRNEDLFWRSRIRQILVGFGFSETYNYSLVRKMALRQDYGQPELLNSVSEEFGYLRAFLFPGLLKNISANAKYTDRIKLFEFGKIFYSHKEKLTEQENFAFALFEPLGGKNGSGFYLIKGYIDELLNKLGITDFYYDPAFSKDDEVHGEFFHTAKRANIFVRNKFAGVVGEIHPSLVKDCDIKGIVYSTELDFSAIKNEAEEEHIYQRLSKYPEVVRDIALLVPRDVVVVDVLNLINASGDELLRDVDLFDMFEGENVPDGMKNLAFHLIFQSDERTLTSEEVDTIMSKINEAVSEQGWEVR